VIQYSETFAIEPMSRGVLDTPCAGYDELGAARAAQIIEPIQPNCPTGKSLLIFRNRVKPLLQKYFASRPTQIRCISFPVSSHSEGRIAIVTDAGRDAVDASSALDEMC
jgi:hypothetical protein